MGVRGVLVDLKNSREGKRTLTGNDAENYLLVNWSQTTYPKAKGYIYTYFQKIGLKAIERADTLAEVLKLAATTTTTLEKELNWKIYLVDSFGRGLCSP